MLRIIGDIHQNYDQYLPLLHGVTHSIQVGDLGFDYSYLRRVGLDGVYHKCIAGNHDNYDQTSPEYFKKQSFFLNDYGIHTVGGLPPIFYCRGAWSIDKNYRIGKYPVTWWEEEELSESGLEEAYQLYVKSKSKIAITHECPLSIVKYVSNPDFVLQFGHPSGVIKTRTNAALQRMLEAYQPEKWIFGHYHTRWERKIDGTTFICLDMIRGINNHKAYVDIM